MVTRPEPLPEDLLQPHPRRLPPDTPGYDEILALHAATVRRSGTKYRDPASGLWVMTATYLWDRGYCCFSQCRHCPWVDRPAS
ncbi:MAG TPA: DUF5522 domain-containing protein [Acidimicrobiia bacterium]|jgi:hypothetical protein|nr:DUF5522 domain-containing protein [Acidimicrobiia bacterium]